MEKTPFSKFKILKSNLKFKIILFNIFPPFCITLFISILLFDYISGTSSPSWDFYGDYYTSAYSWWDLGNFFQPPTYLPYLISGIPSHLALQVSSYYVPVGFVAEIFGYTIENAVRLQFVTILFGVIGVYFLLKSWNFSKSVSLVSSFCYFFTAGYFSNASHVDIVRAWSFLPWLMIAVRPKNNYSNKLIFIYAFLWFQFFVGSYPGNIASFLYILLFWVVFINRNEKEKIKYNLFFYFKTIVPGILMSSLKWLPFILTGSGPEITNQIKFTTGILTTLFFPYEGVSNSGDLLLPNDVTQRTFFIVPIFIFLMVFAKKVHKLFFVSIFILVASIILGIDYSLNSHWQENLPLLNISRFRTIDFKPGIAISVTFLSAIGLQNLIKNKSNFRSKINFSFLMIIAGLTTFIVYTFKAEDFLQSDLNLGLKWVSLSILMLILSFILCMYSLQRVAFVILFIGVIYIGHDWTNDYLPTWNNNISATEQVYFGQSSKSLIESKSEIKLISRPKRIGPSLPIPYPGEMIIQYWNKNELLRNYSTGGYVTIKGEEKFQKYVDYAVNKDKSVIIDFLSQESTVLFSTLDVKNSDSCLFEKKCNFFDNTYKFLEYYPNKFKIELNPQESNLYVFINEVNWKGWTAKTCDSNNNCQEVKIVNLENLILQFEIPKNTKYIIVQYNTPNMEISWIVFWVGMALSIIFSLIAERKNDKNTDLYSSI